MAYEAFEDTTLRKVLAVTLNAPQSDPSANPPVVFLDDLAQVCTVPPMIASNILIQALETLC